jgi:hypothetical protein
MYFLRGHDNPLDSVPDYVQRINFYRSPPLDEFPSFPSQEIFFSAFYVGSADMDDVRAAAAEDIIFTDRGDVPLGRQIRKDPLRFTPRTKRVAMHKGRLWAASPRLDYLGDGEWTYEPDLVAFGALEANGTEPFVFFAESTVAVGAGEPDEITAIESWRNQVALVFKVNKFFGILGGDDELDFGIPNISVQLIDPNVGCIAPNTMIDIDGGKAWLGNRGVYFFDGTVARPLDTHKIKQSFDRIPKLRRPTAAAVYNSKERELTLFHTRPGTASAASSFNRVVSRFNFGTRTWVQDELERGVGYATEVRDEDDESYVLWGIEDSTATVFASTPVVMRAEVGFLEGIDVAVTTDAHKIDFLADFGFLDDGLPWLEKSFKEILIEVSSQVPLTLDILIDNKYDSRVDGNSISLPLPTDTDALVWGTGQWGVNKWGSSMQGYTRRVLTTALKRTIPTGKSIRPIISGVNVYDPVKIHSITVFYTAEGLK